MPDSTSTAPARNPESSARAALRVVPRPVPQPTDLPLPDPPRRPFIALARMCVVGGPMLKHVFMVVTSYCPVMASGLGGPRVRAPRDPAAGLRVREGRNAGSLPQAVAARGLDRLDTPMGTRDPWAVGV